VEAAKNTRAGRNILKWRLGKYNEIKFNCSMRDELQLMHGLPEGEKQVPGLQNYRRKSVRVPTKMYSEKLPRT
jgi:hypothetical protein